MQQLFDGKYRILKVLGQGGMGKVFLAENVKLGTLWAIKSVSKKTGEKVDLLAEPNILKRLNHPSLPRIFDILEDSDNIYIIEDYVEGTSLDKELLTAKKFAERIVVEWAKQICDVLIYLHTQKPNPIIYRDMKPANIMLTGDGKVKMIDFGIAREFKEESKSDTTYIGTRGYAAPEQYGTAQTDARTDIYSFGVTLYHLLTGKSPNEPPYEIRPVRQFDTSLSQGIEYIIEKCTQQDPEKRYQSVEKLLHDLNNIHKLNSEYRKSIIFRNLKVAFFIGLLTSFSYLTYAGVLQLEREKIEAYENMIQSGISLSGEKQYDKAVETFKQAALKIPERVESYRETAHVYLSKRSYDECINYVEKEVLNKIESSRKDADILYIVGTAYFEKQEYKNAAAYFEDARKLAPNHADYGRDLAVSYARMGELNKAEPILEEIKSKGIAEEVTWYVGGEILAAKKDLNNAVSSFEKCLSMTKDEYLKQKAFLSTAEIYKKNTDKIENAVDKEIAVLEKAGAELKEKNNTLVIEMLGEAYYSRAISKPEGKSDFLKKSAVNFELLISSGYERAYIYRNIGIIYQQIEDYKKSEEAFLKMKELSPEDFRPYLQLALLYADMENKKPNESRNYKRTNDNYQLALKFSPEGDKNPELKQLVNLISELKKKNWIQ